MGIAKGAAKVLLKEAARRPFKGRVLTLGRQDIYFSYDQLQGMAMGFGVGLSDPGDLILSHKPAFATKGYISDDCLLRSLGFFESKALDISDYDFADYIFDLNSSEVPEHLLDAFDVIIDGGTIEHVFHVPNALNNLYKMLRQGGRIIHLSPSSNHIDHGFYMFSPTLFWDFYEANRFEINNFQVFRCTPRHDVDPWEISDYQPGCLKRVSFGGLDNGMYGIICIATKTKDSTGDIIPQQGVYVYDVWKTKESPKYQRETVATSASRYSEFQGIKDTLRRVPLLFHVFRLLTKVYRLFRRKLPKKPPKKGLSLEVVARY